MNERDGEWDVELMRGSESEWESEWEWWRWWVDDDEWMEWMIEWSGVSGNEWVSGSSDDEWWVDEWWVSGWVSVGWVGWVVESECESGVDGWVE